MKRLNLPARDLVQALMTEHTFDAQGREFVITLRTALPRLSNTINLYSQNKQTRHIISDK